VFGIAGRRLAEGVVALFALLGFAYVPLGHKTALEHLLNIFSTPAAQSAGRELRDAALHLKDRLVTSVLTAHAGPEAQPTPEPAPLVPTLPVKPRR
jgi:hypothetical protein